MPLQAAETSTLMPLASFLTNSMRSILLVKTSSLGDVIHNLPVVSDLLRTWPQLAIDWVVEENFAEIPRLHPGVRRVLPVAIRGAGANSSRRLRPGRKSAHSGKTCAATATTW